jgi:uncharacterized protein YheU (UPF0270 family)
VANFIEIPPGRLEPDTLENLVEEFVTRDGTDYGEQETPLETRRRQLLRQLAEGEAVILFDIDSESWDFVERRQGQRLLQGQTAT